MRATIPDEELVEKTQNIVAHVDEETINETNDAMLTVEDNETVKTDEEQTNATLTRKKIWKTRIFTILKFLSGPVAAFPFFFDILNPGHILVSRCAAVTIWMGFWWLLEPVPLACTCLLPTVLFPLTGLLSATQTSSSYFGDLTFLFIGSYVMAIALEKWELHKRFALIVLRALGTRPKLILLGFMTLSWFISQWLSNSATAAMLLPMAVAILTSVQSRTQQAEDSAHLVMDPFAKSIMLGTAYASSIGGYATLTGTGTNLMLAAQMQTLFPKSTGVITYLSWYLFNMPMSIVMLAILYVYFVLLFIRKYEFPKQQPIPIQVVSQGEDDLGTEQVNEPVVEQLEDTSIRNLFQEEYKKLGPWRIEDISISILFVLMALLWITRELPGAKIGWPNLLFWGSSHEQIEYVTDGTVAMAITILLFILPSKNTGGRLMDWKTVHDKMPWNIVLLLGSGFALSKAFSESKFADYVAQTVGNVSGSLHPFVLLFILCVAVSVLTEFTSNITTNS